MATAIKEGYIGSETERKHIRFDIQPSTKMKDTERLDSYDLRFESIVRTIRLNNGSFGRFERLIDHEFETGNAADEFEAEDIVESSSYQSLFF